jgi:PAS domain S-box-containing protein
MTPGSNHQPSSSILEKNQGNLLEAMPHIVWLANPAGEITYFNGKWEEYTSLTTASSLGWDFLLGVHPEERERVKSEWQQAFEKGQSYETEVHLRSGLGTYHQFIARGEPMKEESGQIVQWVGTFTLAGKLEKTEAQFQQEEHFLRALLDNISDGIVACDAKGIITLFNPVAEGFHGGPAEPIPPQEWAKRYDLYLPGGKTPMPQEQIPLFRALQGEIVRDVEMAIAPEGAATRILKASGNAIVAPSGEKLGAVVVMRDITERKRAKAAVLERERRFRAIFDGAFQFIGLLQPDGILLEVNQTALEFGGVRPEEVIGRPLWETPSWQISVETQQQLRQAIATAASGQLVRYEVNLLRGDKTVVTIDFSLKPVLGDDGGVGLLIAEGRDISQRKQAEAEILRLNRDLERRVAQRTAQLEAANRSKDELLAREKAAREQIELYKDIVENMPVGLCVWHFESSQARSFRLVAANPAATKLLCKNLDECRGLLLSKCFPLAPEDREILQEAHAEVIRSQQPKELGEFYYSNGDNEQSVFTIKIFPLPDSFVGMAIEDITERTWIEQALLESTQRYRLVVNNVKEVIFQTDINGLLTFLNPAWIEITGFTALESLNYPFVDFISSPEEKRRCEKLFQDLIEQRLEYFSGEIQTKTKKGKLRWLEIKAQINVNVKGVIVGVCGTINDVTERKETQELLEKRAEELARVNSVLLRTTGQLKKRNQELDRFAYVTSHDLKAPLRAIANLSEWIEEDLAEVLTEDTRHQMNLLRGRVHRMEALINGLLQYSRVGRIKTEPEIVDVNTLLTEIISSLEYPDEFRIEIEGEMPTLRTERLPLQQVFTNLISNGIKHRDRSDGRVKLSVREQGYFYEFSVTDDGPGMDPKYHQKVFVIFQTLEARDKTENTGIGLSIVKKAVETQGGTITLESQVGEGSTFRFTWPK